MNANRTDENPIEDVPDPRRWLILLVMTGSLAMVMLDTTIVAVSLPSIQANVPGITTRTSRGSAGGGAAAGAAGSNRRNRGDDDKKDDKKDEKEPGKMSKGAALALGLGGAGLGSRALLASGILGPALLAGGLGGLFGSSSDPTGGQSLTPDLGSGSGSGPAGQSALGSVFDRLTSAYGYIPGFNPAGIALQILGKRVGV